MGEKEIKKLVKQATLRNDDDVPCPFGLHISGNSCRLVGGLIEKMAPINCLGNQSSEAEEKEIAEANQYLYKWQCPGTKCLYADKVFDGITQCTFGDGEAQGLKDNGNALQGSPYFWKEFSGIGMDGLFSGPLGYFQDAPIQPFYGMYSLENPRAASVDDKDKIKK